MNLEGVIVNGRVEFDRPSNLPEGTRVRVNVAGGGEMDIPVEPYNRETELEILRETIADVKAGRTKPFDEAMAEIAAKYHLAVAPK